MVSAPDPSRRRWTRTEYYHAGESGIFRPDERLELIEGEIITKVTPMNTPHASSIALTVHALSGVFGSGMHLRIQSPLAIDEFNEPEPDVAVVSGDERTYEEAHPTTALLVVEIADTTLRLDRTTKASLYARAGIAEYWIVNLNDRLLEVHRQPAPAPGRSLGFAYGNVFSLTEQQSISALEAATVTIAVADLLPRPRP